MIPRFYDDYNFWDFLVGLKAVFINSHIDLNQLSNLFNDKKFIFTNNGRTSLYVILRSLDLPKGSKIGVPLYSCSVVFDAIEQAGYMPYFIDVDIENYTLNPEDLLNKIEKISALVVIHTFGRPAHMEKIIKYAKGIPVIEDCAHSIFSEYKGKITGIIGDISFFSLAKYPNAGGGGMILCDENKFDEIRNEVKQLHNPTFLKEVIHPYYKNLYSLLYKRPWFGLFSFSLGSYLDDKTHFAKNTKFESKKIRKSDLAVFLRKIEFLKKKVEIQRSNSFFLINELNGLKITLPIEQEETYCNYYLFPVMFKNEKDRDNAYLYLRKNNVDTVKLWSTSPRIAKERYGYNNDCPNSEICASQILLIPNYYSLCKTDLLRIITLLKKFNYEYL